ncbi:hypothetical protein [Paenibacillus oleatilyticus]|uniref:Uncharacterized protein n=1 Tax=Paenibacillus oleatilyticus TaxID=2594886 RepID=A0ABV4VA57_9BACL
MEKENITMTGLDFVQNVQYFIIKASTDLKGIAYRMSDAKEGSETKSLA